jgi:lipopolysaccharide/colanic/teichoic acid biosynthesis glycosyltransferase
MSSLDAVNAISAVDPAVPVAAVPPRNAPPRVMIVGTGERAARLARVLSLSGKTIVGAIDNTPQPALARCVPAVPWLGGLDRLVQEAIDRHVEELFVAMPLRSGFDAWARAGAVARELGIPATFEFDLIDGGRTRLAPGRSDTAAILYNQHPSRVGVKRIVKRLIDVVVSFTALVLLAPVFLLTALAIAATSRGPILFCQQRVGLSRRRFRMLKFRTMRPDAVERPPDLATLDPHGVMFKVACDPRVTPLGNWLRRSSLDELPQLVNVLKGEMSLVGPRPMPLWVYSAARMSEFHRRSSVLPGVTGLWQVNGRAQDLARMTRDDLEYVDRWSLLLDMTVLIRTPWAVLRGTGAR